MLVMVVLLLLVLVVVVVVVMEASRWNGNDDRNDDGNSFVPTNACWQSPWLQAASGKLLSAPEASPLAASC